MRTGGWKTILFLVLLLFSSSLQFSSSSLAEGLVMRGAPALPENFSHFPYADPDAPKGGILRLAETGTFDNLAPWLIKGRAPWQLDWVYDRLMARNWDEPFGLYPLIAERAVRGPDTLTFDINPRARFHDGTPITAADVKFSWSFLTKHGRPNTRRIYAMVDRAEITGSRTITFHFKKDFDPEAPMILAMMTVLPKAFWEAKGEAATRTTLAPPLASGPYRIAAVEAGRKLVLSRVPDYWAADMPTRRGQFNADTITLDFYRDDAAALLAFKSGAYDLRRETDPRRWTKQYEAEGVQKVALPVAAPAPLRALVFNTRRPMFQNAGVRRALALAFDATWLNKNLFYGLYAQSHSIFPRSPLAHQAAPIGGGGREDLRRAQQLLQDAGWQVKDQKLQNAAGDIFAFEILLNDPADEKIALHFARALARLGIRAVLRTVDAAQFTGRLEQFDYDMTVAQWASSLSPGSEQAVYWGSRAAQQHGSRNYAGIQDPVVDGLISQLNQADSADAFTAAARALDGRIMAGDYFVPLFHAPADWLAIWPQRVGMPEKPSLYGPMLETFWAKP